MCEKPYTRADLDMLIKELLGVTDIPFQIKKQIREFYERGYTYKGIARALCFLVDERKFNLRASYQQYGIGIVKNVYNEAEKFYLKLKAEQEKQAQRQQQIIQVIHHNEPTVIICGRADGNKKIRKNSIDIESL